MAKSTCKSIFLCIQNLPTLQIGRVLQSRSREVTAVTWDREKLSCRLTWKERKYGVRIKCI